MRTHASAILILVGLATLATTEARATDVGGQSSSFSISSNLVATDYSLIFGATPGASGSAPPAYNVTNGLNSFTQGAGGKASITTGSLGASAASDVDGASGSKTTSASTFADNVSFEMGGNVILFSANVVATNSLNVQGDFGAFTSNGYADFSGASLSVFGTPYFFSTVPSPNTVMYNSGGLRIVANSQTINGDGLTSRGISITALDLTFTNFGYSGEVVNGELMFTHAQATMTAAPEPFSLAALGLFAITLCRTLWRRAIVF